MKLVSTKEIAELLSMTRETVGKKLAEFRPKNGPGNAKLYPSDTALRKCLGLDEASGEVISFSEAQRQLTIKRGQQIDLQNEVLRKERIPLEVVEATNEDVHGNIGGILKAAVGKEFTEERLRDCLSELRSIPERLHWK